MYQKLCGVIFFLLSLTDLYAQSITSQNQPATAPRTRITQLRRFDQNVPLAPFAQNLTVRHYDNYLEIAFAADSLRLEKLTFRYRLAGVDTGWVETQQQFVQYKNLADGKYGFEVQASNDSSDWSAPAKIDFVLEPPFWERLWFFLFLTLLTVGSAVYFITFRVRQLLAIERLRTRIAADLHDNIGAGLTEISILSEIGAKQISQQPQNGAAEHFDKISHVSRALVDRMNDIIWLVNPKRDSLYDLIQQLGSSFEEISTCSGIVFRTHNLEILRKVHLPMEYRQQLYYIFKEALHNSLKHSAAKEVVLEARMQGKRLAMRLKDDGKGFDQTQIPARNGLKNMKSRAAIIGGALAIHSTSGEGTVVEFNGKVSWV
ncbi:histidine kinase [candidate division KSB1 bacterium]|nr:histidine kinase [candidate division KSB1 bacterium]